MNASMDFTGSACGAFWPCASPGGVHYAMPRACLVAGVFPIPIVFSGGVTLAQSRMKVVITS